MILASNPDRAVTVRERDPTYPGNDVSGGPRGALVDEVKGDSICDQIPLPHGHGSVNFRFSMIPSSLKFQVSPKGVGGFRSKDRRKTQAIHRHRRPGGSVYRAGFGTPVDGPPVSATELGHPARIVGEGPRAERPNRAEIGQSGHPARSRPRNPGRSLGESLRPPPARGPHHPRGPHHREWPDLRFDPFCPDGTRASNSRTCVRGPSRGMRPGAFPRCAFCQPFRDVLPFLTSDVYKSSIQHHENHAGYR